jgi:hypothetical protein
MLQIGKMGDNPSQTDTGSFQATKINIGDFIICRRFINQASGRRRIIHQVNFFNRYERCSLDFLSLAFTDSRLSGFPFMEVDRPAQLVGWEQTAELILQYLCSLQHFVSASKAKEGWSL